MFDPRAHLRSLTERTSRLLTNDLLALPAEQRNLSPGGCAHNALHIVAECAMVNGLIARYLTTGVVNRLPPAERDAHLNSFDTTEKALAYLEQETRTLLATIEEMEEATLGDPVEGLFNRAMTRFGAAELPATHMMYHDGQLNYLQSLHGDAENHWG